MRYSKKIQSEVKCNRLYQQIAKNIYKFKSGLRKKAKLCDNIQSYQWQWQTVARKMMEFAQVNPDILPCLFADVDGSRCNEVRKGHIVPQCLEVGKDYYVPVCSYHDSKSISVAEQKFGTSILPRLGAFYRSSNLGDKKEVSVRFENIGSGKLEEKPLLIERTESGITVLSDYGSEWKLYDNSEDWTRISYKIALYTLYLTGIWGRQLDYQNQKIVCQKDNPAFDKNLHQIKRILLGLEKFDLTAPLTIPDKRYYTTSTNLDAFFNPDFAVMLCGKSSFTTGPRSWTMFDHTAIVRLESNFITSKSLLHYRMPNFIVCLDRVGEWCRIIKNYDYSNRELFAKKFEIGRGEVDKIIWGFPQ